MVVGRGSCSSRLWLPEKWEGRSRLRLVPNGLGRHVVELVEVLLLPPSLAEPGPCDPCAAQRGLLHSAPGKQHRGSRRRGAALRGQLIGVCPLLSTALLLLLLLLLLEALVVLILVLFGRGGPVAHPKGVKESHG